MTITKKDFKDHCQNLINEISSIINPILEKKPAKVFVGYGFRRNAINNTELGEEFSLLDDYEIKHVLIKEVGSLVECMRELPKVRGKLSLESLIYARCAFMSQFDILSLAEAETPLKSDVDQSLEADSYSRFQKRIHERTNYVLDEIDGDRVIVLRVLTDLAYSILTFERGLKIPETNAPVDDLNFYDKLQKLKLRISLNEKELEIANIKKDSQRPIKDQFSEFAKQGTGRTLNDNKEEVLSAIAYFQSINWIRAKSEVDEVRDFIDYLKEKKGKILKISYVNDAGFHLEKVVVIKHIPEKRAARRWLDAALKYKEKYHLGPKW